MSPAEAIAAMQEIAQRGSADPENDHLDADDVLCALLLTLGHGELVTLWRGIPKWYA
jgi:hypothetical protein